MNKTQLSSAIAYRAAPRIHTVVMIVAVGARSRQACARRRIPIPGRHVCAAARELLAVGTEAHGSDHARMPPQGAQQCLPCLCADEVYAPIRITRRDDVAGGPVLHAVNPGVKSRCAPAARSVVVLQDQIHHVGLAEPPEQSPPDLDALARVAVPGRTARSAVARARRHVSGLRRAGGSFLRRAHRRRCCVPPVRGAPDAAAALGGPKPARRSRHAEYP